MGAFDKADAKVLGLVVFVVFRGNLESRQQRGVVGVYFFLRASFGVEASVKLLGLAVAALEEAQTSHGPAWVPLGSV